MAQYFAITVDPSTKTLRNPRSIGEDDAKSKNKTETFVRNGYKDGSITFQENTIITSCFLDRDGNKCIGYTVVLTNGINGVGGSHPWFKIGGNEANWIASIRKCLEGFCISDNQIAQSTIPQAKAVVKRQASELNEASVPKTTDTKINVARQNLLDCADYFLQEFKKQFGMNFHGSEYESLFYPDDKTLNALLQWNASSERRDHRELIDIYNFMEGTIGNFETAEIILLGNNPGANGATDSLQTRSPQIKKMLEVLHNHPEVFLRNKNGDTQDFYPLNSKLPANFLPWFRQHLYGSEGAPGFMTQLPNDRDYAPFFATAERFPFHSGNFAKGYKMIRGIKPEIIDNILKKVKTACNEGKLLIAYNGYREWVDDMKRNMQFDLAQYDKFYIQPHQNGYLSRKNLFHYQDYVNHTKCHNAFDEIASYLKQHI